MKTIKVLKVQGETIYINRFSDESGDPDDYSIEFVNGDCSVRGSLKDIKEEYRDYTGNELQL